MSTEILARIFNSNKEEKQDQIYEKKLVLPMNPFVKMDIVFTCTKGGRVFFMFSAKILDIEYHEGDEKLICSVLENYQNKKIFDACKNADDWKSL